MKKNKNRSRINKDMDKSLCVFLTHTVLRYCSYYNSVVLLVFYFQWVFVVFVQLANFFQHYSATLLLGLWIQYTSYTQHGNAYCFAWRGGFEDIWTEHRLMQSLNQGSLKRVATMYSVLQTTTRTFCIDYRVQEKQPKATYSQYVEL